MTAWKLRYTCVWPEYDLRLAEGLIFVALVLSQQHVPTSIMLGPSFEYETVLSITWATGMMCPARSGQDGAVGSITNRYGHCFAL